MGSTFIKEMRVGAYAVSWPACRKNLELTLTLSTSYLSVESEDLEDGFDEEPLNDQQWILQR